MSEEIQFRDSKNALGGVDDRAVLLETSKHLAQVVKVLVSVSTRYVNIDEIQTVEDMIYM